MNRALVHLLLCMATLLSSGELARAQCQYSVQLGPLPHQCMWGTIFPFLATGMNNFGAWCGYRLECYPEEGEEGLLPVYCPPGGTPQLLPWPSGTGEDGAQATAVNDAGIVVGYFNGGPHGVTQIGCIWWPDGMVTEIAPAPGATNSRAVAINNSNMVVGMSGGQGYFWHDGVMSPIPMTGGTTRAISDTGFVTGYMVTDDGNRAIRWKDGILTVLAPANAHHTCAAWDVNDAGIVVGVSTTPAPGGGFFSDATVWMEHETIVLPLPPGFTEGSARTINNFGVITGEVRTGPTSSITRAMWINGVPYLINDLTLPGSPLVGSIADVNQVGQLITANARILTPIGQSPGDLNGDCAVDGADLAVVLSEWGPREWSVADINGDGIVDGIDLAVVLGQWGPAPTAPMLAVPPQYPPAITLPEGEGPRRTAPPDPRATR